jgi:hypothetical protein
MSRRQTGWLISAAALAVCSSVEASPIVPSIAIKFGANEPVAPSTPLPVNGAAGVLNTATWNNTSGATGTANNLLADVAGTPTPTAASANWTSAGTWASTGRGEENNTAPAGNNRNLMAGYLDTGNTSTTSVTLTGLPIVAPAFDVYVYIQGGVNGRGGNYTIGALTDRHDVTAAFNGTFLEDTNLAGTTAGSNYIVFHALPAATGFTLTAQAVDTGNGDTTLRAPINGIEIVAVPEPAMIGLAGLAGTMALRRRRR